MIGDDAKSVAFRYFNDLDSGKDILPLFAEDAQVSFPKWGTARGLAEISSLFQDVGLILAQVKHHHESFHLVGQDDVLVVEGRSMGETRDGVKFDAGKTHAGHFCDVFEIRDGKIKRLAIYLDPDYWGANLIPYPWLSRDETWPKGR